MIEFLFLLIAAFLVIAAGYGIIQLGAMILFIIIAGPGDWIADKYYKWRER